MSKTSIEEAQVWTRPNVCIVIVNDQHRVLLAERINGGWQFPQGGIDSNENAEQALYREMQEEVGLTGQDTRMIGNSESWFEYDIPEELQTISKSGVLTTKQRQRWYLLRLIVKDSAIYLNSTLKPEFKQWRWVSFWHPLYCVVDFKKQVYRQGLTAMASLLNTRK